MHWLSPCPLLNYVTGRNAFLLASADPSVNAFITFAETLELVVSSLSRVGLEPEISIVSEEIVDRPVGCGYRFSFRRSK